MAAGETAKQPAALVDAAMAALPDMLDRRTDLFVFTVRPSGPAGQSLRYTCITLIGLTAAARAGWRPRVDVARVLQRITERRAEITNPGEIGLLLWCLADYHERPTPAHTDILDRVPIESEALQALTTTELGWLVSGLSRTAQLMPGRADVADLAYAAYRALTANQSELTGLFSFGGRASGAVRRRLRRQLGFFDNQVYGIHAAIDYYRAFDDATALAMAQRCVDQIVAAQGPLGQWAWHYDVRSGAVVDRYPVYSVHQHGMGPMALRAVTKVTGRRFDEPIARSVAWIFGANELGDSMLDHDRGVIWRSIRRRIAHGRLIHVFKLLSVARLPWPRERLARMVNTRGQLERDLECRPYELGWLLLALARR
jgi:hypothetical protein